MTCTEEDSSVKSSECILDILLLTRSLRGRGEGGQRVKQ